MIINNADLTGSFTVNGVNYITNIPTTGSNTYVGTQITSGSVRITGSLQVTGSISTTGTLTAQTLVVQTVTSSIVYSSGSNIFGNSQSNVQQMTGSVNVSGSIGIGYNSPTVALQVSGTIAVGNNTTGWGRFLYDTATNQVRIQASKDGTDSIGLSFYTQASGGGFDERMTISGSNVGIGTTDPQSIFDVTNINSSAYDGSNTLTSGQTMRIANTSTTSGIAANLLFVATGAGGGNGLGTISGVNTGTGSLALTFATRDSGGSVGERMRITSGGNVLINRTTLSGDGGGALFQLSQSNANWIHYIENTASSGGVYGSYINFKNQAPNNNVSYFTYFADSSVARFYVYSNGGIANFQANNLNLSDERTKKDILPLESYWNKFKAIEIVKFKYKDQTHDDFNIGIIAQQVEKVAPEFVDVDGWDTKPKFDDDGNMIVSDDEPLKSIYTADLHHATIKVLQEAMAKIETLETEVTELKALIAAK